MIPVYNLQIPEYKTGNIDICITNKTRHYGLDDIPVAFIKNSPDFDVTALKLRNFIRSCFKHEKLCIRGISLKEHNSINKSILNADTLINIIINTGSDRYNSEIAGKRYDNLENQHIDFFAYDVVPFSDDNDLTFFFQSFYWFGFVENGEPNLVDIIIVYDCNLLNRIEHHYKDREDIKRDGFAFCTTNKTECIKCIIKINSV